MPALNIVWTSTANGQFRETRKRAAASGRLSDFDKIHSDIVEILCDLDRALEKSDPLYRTKKAGGMVRHLLHKCISVTFCVFDAEQVGWITKYQLVPADWLDNPQ